MKMCVIFVICTDQFSYTHNDSSSLAKNWMSPICLKGVRFILFLLFLQKVLYLKVASSVDSDQTPYHAYQSFETTINTNFCSELFSLKRVYVKYKNAILSLFCCL